MDNDTATPPQPQTDADFAASDTARAADVTSAPGTAGGTAPAEPVPPEPAIAQDEIPAEGSAGMGGGSDPEGAAPPMSIKQTLTDKTSEFRGQATDNVRQFAESGKTRATDALDDLARMLSEAADQVDEKLGGQFGQYARSTAEGVQSFSSSLGEKSLDDLMDMGREFVRKSPAAAIGVATALGFVVARLAASGLEQRDQA